MKIEINKMTHTTPTLGDVPAGDLFVLLEDNDVYVKTVTRSYGAITCISLRDGK